MFSGWLRGVNKDVKLLLLLGTDVTCWSLWLSWNDIKKKNVSPMQVIYLVTHWLRTWGYFAEAGFAGYSCSGIAAVDAGGKEFFFLLGT